eukprot:COSAG03_NODE_416_length_8086_cov_5.782772_5_plen_87_part_00
MLKVDCTNEALTRTPSSTTELLARPSLQIYGMFKAAIAAQGPKLVEKVKGVIVYVITAGPNNKKWTFYTDLKNGEGKVGQGRVKKV